MIFISKITRNLYAEQSEVYRVRVSLQAFLGSQKHGLLRHFL
jgi:hypothetical protein